METSPKMQQFITTIADKHGLALTATSNHLRLTNGVYMPLVIEKVGRYQISIAHYAIINGDACQDPEIVLYTRLNQWVPMEIYQILGMSQPVELDDTAERIVAYAPRRQAEIAEFAEWWADNLNDQRWLTDGVKDSK